jgi:hypothetical protein
MNPFDNLARYRPAGWAGSTGGRGIAKAPAHRWPEPGRKTLLGCPAGLHRGETGLVQWLRHLSLGQVRLRRALPHRSRHAIDERLPVSGTSANPIVLGPGLPIPR